MAKKLGFGFKQMTDLDERLKGQYVCLYSGTSQLPGGQVDEVDHSWIVLTNFQYLEYTEDGQKPILSPNKISISRGVISGFIIVFVDF